MARTSRAMTNDSRVETRGGTPCPISPISFPASSPIGSTPLAEKYSLILPDLPGYGWSAAPRAQKDHSPYDKRSMANAILEVMEKLGHVRFRLAGHDRGGRVGYRMALDHPGRIEKLALLDIIPTYTMWKSIDADLAMKMWHWMFLAQPFPLPEKKIGRAH